MSAPLAAVTMAYNEAELLPIWLRHYSREVGAAHCYVVDHGSDDGSTDHLDGVTVLRLPRSAHDDDTRARFISDLCRGLLEYYDAVLHCDVDEIVIADPRHYADLPAYAAAMPADTITAIGLEVVQMQDGEAPIDIGAPVLTQRSWVRFSSALCKPVLSRLPLHWAPGFHCADAPMRFDRLFLFHLRYLDRDQGLRRLAKTRAMPWARDHSGSHQRLPDEQWCDLLRSMASGTRRDAVEFDPHLAPVAPWLKKVIDSQTGRSGQTFTLDLSLMNPELWQIPPRFATRF